MDDVTQGGLIFVGLVAFFAIWLWIDWIRHPKSWCPTCNRTGRRNSSWTARWRNCDDCDGGVRDRRTK